MSLYEIAKKKLFSCRDCRGFTLVELLVALAIGSMLSIGTLGVLNQILVLAPMSENNLVAIRQAQSAGYWIGRDGASAQAITCDNSTPLSTGNPLVISYIKWDATKTTISYSVDDNSTLQRQMVVTNELTGAEISRNQIRIAENIASITALYSQPDIYNSRKILTLTITTQVGNATQTRVYKISPWPS